MDSHHDGTSLQDLVRRRRLDTREALALVRAVALDLAAGHAAGRVHGDIRPATIRVDDAGTPRLTEARTDATSPTGPAAYASPEQVLHGVGDARSDIYALTVTLYELLCGQLPFGGATVEEVQWRQVNEALPDPRLQAPGLGDELTQLLMWGTMKDPDQRPQSVAVFLEHLDRAASAVPAATAASTTGASARSGVLASTGAKVAAVVAALALVGGAALGTWALTGGFGSDTDDGDGALSGKRQGALTVSDGPRGRDLYAYASLDDHDMSVVVMDGTDEIVSVPVTYSEGEYLSQTNADMAWSVDGRWFAFHDDRTLRVVDTEDGSVQERPCEGPGMSDSRWCPGSVAVWGDRVVTFDQLWNWEGTGSDLVVSPAYDLDTTELLSDAEPDSVQWQRLAVAGDRLLASGSDTSRTGEGYRGNDPTVMYAFTRDGSAERMDWVEEVTLQASVPATFGGSAAGGGHAVVVTEGSGGACVYGYSFDLIDPDVPTTSKMTVEDGMFFEGDSLMGQEVGTIHDIWFGRGGELYATASSMVCPDGLDGSEVGTPLSTWRLDDGQWVETGEDGLWAARDLPSGARLTLAADRLPTPDDITTTVGSLVLEIEDDTTTVADHAMGLTAPPLGGEVSTTAAGEADDSEAYRTKCGSPPTFTPVEATNDTGGVTITYEVRAVCPGGQWLNWSQLRVPLVVDGVHWADGWFDYASTPYWIPEGGTLHRLTYPYGQLQVPYSDIVDAIDNQVDVITVPCEPGPDNDDDAPVPSSATTPANDDTLVSSGETATDEELQESALEALRRIAAEDTDAVEALNWTAQLSSKKPGTRDDGIVYDTYDKILELHLSHRSRYPQSLLVWSGDWPGSYGDTSNDYWITLSGDSHASGADVLDWCDSEGWGAGDCWAKRLARSGEPMDNTRHPKGGG